MRDSGNLLEQTTKKTHIKLENKTSRYLSNMQNFRIYFKIFWKKKNRFYGPSITNKDDHFAKHCIKIVETYFMSKTLIVTYKNYVFSESDALKEFINKNIIKFRC